MDWTSSNNTVLLGTITSTAANSSCTFSQNLGNFSFVLITISQGYETVVYCGPVGGSIGRTISMCHGRPHGNYGAQGMIRLNLTSASLCETLAIYGWSGAAVKIYGVK